MTAIPKEELNIFQSLKDVKVVFDVGARIDTDYITLRPDIELHAFEPYSQFFEELKRRVGANPNVYLNNYGLGDREEMGFYNAKLQAFYGGEIWDNRSQPDIPGIYLPIKTLDWYIEENNIKRIDFLKIDTEGYDYKVLLGGKKAIKITKYIQYEHCDNKEQFHRLLEPEFKLEYIGSRNVLCTRND